MKKNKLILSAFLAFISATPALAQQSNTGWVESLRGMDSTQLALLIMIMVVLGVTVLLLLLLIYLMTFISGILKQENPELAQEPSFWERFKKRFVVGEMKPIEKEHEIMLDHSYDGIVELDNFMPPWLKYLFYGTIVFGIGYFMYYSVFDLGKSQIEEYQVELELAALEAEERKAFALASIDETNVTLDQSEAVIQAGKSLYQNNCVACHGADGGGGVGPNFTDEYWLHGGSIKDVFTVIKYGVPEKGMIPWQDQLSPEEIKQVANFVLSLQGTTPTNPKEPQGEKYVPEEKAPADTQTAAIEVGSAPSAF
ncbi:c-type cytochrome [Echinicola jeungdonensis]|uniref:Cbb3-type cytochrome c oxidase N-terminal domain-containing protein n=1 Tax=Echinicola jeungdonensis TaxID=709343 RepID=A0ABV5J1F3_9BACT|nr:cbb3-type cytochrome c oxidase N-terminal domain-containing protein [Echinicola jeungdonensis]MDN3667787.1 c-type cytochrome [Echinicola jeungdonensis]